MNQPKCVCQLFDDVNDIVLTELNQLCTRESKQSRLFKQILRAPHCTTCGKEKYGSRTNLLAIIKLLIYIVNSSQLNHHQRTVEIHIKQYLANKCLLPKPCFDIMLALEALSIPFDNSSFRLLLRHDEAKSQLKLMGESHYPIEYIWPSLTKAQRRTAKTVVDFK